MHGVFRLRTEVQRRPFNVSLLSPVIIAPAIDSVQSPVLDASVDNTFTTVGFSGNITSAVIESPSGDYPISVFTTTELIVNGDMSAGLAPWDNDVVNAAASINAGALRVTSTGSPPAQVRQIITNLVIGLPYVLTVDYVTDGMSGNFLLSVGTGPGVSNIGSDILSAPGVARVDFVATSETLHYTISGIGPAIGEFFEVDNISLVSPNTFNMPDVSSYTTPTAGTPFNSASHEHQLRVGYLTESASAPIVVNPQTGWAVIEVASAITTQDSVFYNFPSAPVDTDQVYYPTTGGISVGANGAFDSGSLTSGSVGMKLFDTVTGVWIPFNVAVIPDPPVIQPPVVDQGVSGGGWWYTYDNELGHRKRKKAELELLQRKTKEIQDETERQLALEIRKKEAKQNRADELRRLKVLVDEHKSELKDAVSQKAILAAEAAIIKGTFSAMEMMERELNKSREEELFIIEAAKIILSS